MHFESAGSKMKNGSEVVLKASSPIIPLTVFLVIFIALEIPLLPLTCGSLILQIVNFWMLPVLAIGTSIYIIFWSRKYKMYVGSNGFGKDRAQLVSWDSVNQITRRYGFQSGLELKTKDGKKYHLFKSSKGFNDAVSFISDHQGPNFKISDNASVRGFDTIIQLLVFGIIVFGLINESYHLYEMRGSLMKRAALNRCSGTIELMKALRLD